MSAFITYDARASSKATKGSQRNAKVLFVDCNNGGKPSEQTKALLNRHAAIKSKPVVTKKSGSAALHEDSNQNKATSAKSTGATTLRFRVNEQKASSGRRGQVNQTSDKEQDIKQAVIKWRNPKFLPGHRLSGDPRSASLITNTPFGAFRSPSPNVGNELVTTIINWFFLGKDEAASRGTLQVATDHWMKQLWDWATAHEALFEGVVLNVMKKRLDLAGTNKTHQREYLQQKGQIIHRLRQNVSNDGPDLDSATMFVIANMAIHAFQDGDPRAARLHLEALEAIKAPMKIRSYEWIGTWIVDFRLALILGSKPAFSYYAPFDQDVVLGVDEQELQARTEDAMSCLPLSAFYQKTLESLLRQLWQFYLASPSLEASSTEPFGMIYNLEFTLRSLHADLLLDQGECEPSAALRTCIELAVYAIQFHLWIVARHWEPLSWGVRILCVKRMLAILTTTPDFVHLWMHECCGSVASLMWILSTLTVFCIDEGDGLAPIPMLLQTIELLDISTLDEYVAELRKWPWLENWHAVQVPLVWQQVEEFRAADTNDLDPSTMSWKSSCAPKSRPRKLFVGAVEFYDI